MYMKVLPIGEARRRLPELVRRVALTQEPIGIGRRGNVEAVLVPPSAAARATVERKPLVGLVELIGGADALEEASLRLREELLRSLETTAAVLDEPAPRPRPRPRNGR
jgi:prevent-host-death family protein